MKRNHTRVQKTRRRHKKKEKREKEEEEDIAETAPPYKRPRIDCLAPIVEGVPDRLDIERVRMEMEDFRALCLREIDEADSWANDNWEKLDKIKKELGLKNPRDIMTTIRELKKKE